MALTKTQSDLLGTQAALHSTTTAETHTGTLIDTTGKIGAVFTFRVSYTGVTATVRPKLEIFTSAENNASYQDTIAYETVELNYATTADYQISVPVRFMENINYLNWKLTSPTFSAGTVSVYLGVTVSSL